MIKIEANRLDKALARIDLYLNLLGDKKKEFLEKLAEIGIETASVKFANAQYDGFNDVTVEKTPEWIDDNTLAIVARGQAVAFIEFGTGVHYTEQHPRAQAVGAIRGSYGQGKGKQKAWGYYGHPGTHGKVIYKRNKSVVITRGNPPARAMYDASKTMRAEIRKVAKEVFNS
jgi:hypothetical protein